MAQLACQIFFKSSSTDVGRQFLGCPLTSFALFCAYAYRPWQCLYFLPEPQGQSSLRPTLPQVDWFFGSRLAALAFGAGASETSAKAIASSPVFGSNLCAS